MLVDYGAAVVCHGVNSGEGVIAAKSFTPEALVKELIAKHGRIDPVIINDSHPRFRAC